MYEGGVLPDILPPAFYPEEDMRPGLSVTYQVMRWVYPALQDQVVDAAASPAQRVIRGLLDDHQGLLRRMRDEHRDALGLRQASHFHLPKQTQFREHRFGSQPVFST